MNVPLLDELIAQKEGPTIEFKKLDIISNGTKLATLMVAFANTHGGSLLIGVNDDGSIEGKRSKKEHETHIMNIARDKCTPPIVPEFSVVKKEEGDVYVIKVMRFQKLPHAVITENGPVHFIRVGSTNRVATQYELALLFESAQKSAPLKKPELELLLINEKGEAVKEILVEPTYVKKIVKKIRRPTRPDSSIFNHASLIESIRLPQVAAIVPNLFEEHEPPKYFVPIGLQIENIGSAPAQGIRVSLEFPAECKLIDKQEAVGGLGKFPSKHSGGLFVHDEGKLEANGWIDTLGNDLAFKSFDEVYVRFPETEQQYKIRGHIIQHNFPLVDFEFTISVEPRFVEEIEEVYDDNP